jgi:hypothetical protein
MLLWPLLLLGLLLVLGLLLLTPLLCTLLRALLVLVLCLCCLTGHAGLAPRCSSWFTPLIATEVALRKLLCTRQASGRKNSPPTLPDALP